MREGIVIGVNTIISRNGAILLGKRCGGYLPDTWGLPGGHLERGERLEDAAQRELFEETGITARGLVFESLVNQPDSAEHHYMQITFSAADFIGEPQVLESDKCQEWRWFALDALPDDLFHPHKESIKLFQQRKYFAEQDRRLA